MIGIQSGQLTFTQVEAWCAHLLDPSSIYGLMNRLGALWFPDEVYASMYAAGGRPSVPPGLLARALMLQRWTNEGDRELVDRIRFDLRFKYALNVPIEYEGFDPSLLSVFRSRLMKHEKERLAFEQSLSMARACGLLDPDEDQVGDSAPIHGAAAVQDTYTLLRTSIEKILRALKPFEIRGFLPPFPADKYLKSRGKANIAWNDDAQKYAHLAELVEDAKALLNIGDEVSSDEQDRPVDTRLDDGDLLRACSVLRRIVKQDIVDTENGPRIRKGKDATSDRVISTNDPEMRHGHKTSKNLFAGYKGSITATTREIVTSIDVIAANEPDARPVPGQVDYFQRLGLYPKRLYLDCAYGSAETRLALKERDVEVVAKVPDASHLAKHFPKASFRIQMDGTTAAQVTCPTGKTTTAFRDAKDSKERPVQVAQFKAEDCKDCPLRSQCTPLKKKGREVELHHREDVLQAARQRAAEPGFREEIKTRCIVERINAQLQRHGLKAARYLGKQKTKLQALFAGAVHNFWKAGTHARGRAVIPVPTA